MSTPHCLVPWLVSTILILWSAANVFPHEGPEHEIEELTEEIRKLGESADLLTERAIEYRVLGKYSEASRDLERATRLDPGSIHAYREWSRVLFLSGKIQEAIDTVSRALALKVEDAVELGGLHATRAEFLRAKNDYKKALDDCQLAIKAHQQNPEWYLLRSDLHDRLGMTKERVVGIEEGIKETGSGVLEIERVEALIRDQQFEPALEKIESELKSSRMLSSWLIRRARVRHGMGKKAEAHDDLRVALAEIANRLNLTTPDVPLLLDKALAHELLGEKPEARRCYELARDHGAEDIVKEKLKELKGPAGTLANDPKDDKVEGKPRD